MNVPGAPVIPDHETWRRQDEGRGGRQGGLCALCLCPALQRSWRLRCDSHVTLHIPSAYGGRELGSCQLSMSVFNQLNRSNRR